MRFHPICALAMGCSIATLPLQARATVQVAIDLTHQRMHVASDEGRFDWPISSARSGFSTPDGSYAPTHLELMHYSRKYHMSPMPHAIFFRGGYAIHGTYSTASLGRPASHGCVRLSPGHAALLYDMVLHEGARISISGTPPTAERNTLARYDGPRDPRRWEEAYRDERPNADADALARLAPRSNRSTARQDYGDAPYARRRAYGHPAYAGYGVDPGVGYAYTPYPLAPYQPNYTLTPSYYSSPQIVTGASYYEQTPLLPFGAE